MESWDWKALRLVAASQQRSPTETSLKNRFDEDTTGSPVTRSWYGHPLPAVKKAWLPFCSAGTHHKSLLRVVDDGGDDDLTALRCCRWRVEDGVSLECLWLNAPSEDETKGSLDQELSLSRTALA